MPRMIVIHTVEDFNKWKGVFDGQHDLRGRFGCTREDVYQQHQEPNEVLIVTHWGTREQAGNYGQSQELRDAMQRGGVLGTPSVHFAD